MTKQLFCQFGINKAKITETLLPSEVSLSSEKGAASEKNIPYRQLIGALLHLTNTIRSDIFYAVRCHSRFTHCRTVLVQHSAKYI